MKPNYFIYISIIVVVIELLIFILFLDFNLYIHLCFICSPYDRPRLIETLQGKGVVEIACGGAHSAAITSAGELYTWGKGRYGRLGHGDSEVRISLWKRNLEVLYSE